MLVETNIRVRHFPLFGLEVCCIHLWVSEWNWDRCLCWCFPYISMNLNKNPT